MIGQMVFESSLLMLAGKGGESPPFSIWYESRTCNDTSSSHDSEEDEKVGFLTAP
jgi:hypothetical protein